MKGSSGGERAFTAGALLATALITLVTFTHPFFNPSAEELFPSVTAAEWHAKPFIGTLGEGEEFVLLAGNGSQSTVQLAGVRERFFTLNGLLVGHPAPGMFIVYEVNEKNLPLIRAALEGVPLCQNFAAVLEYLGPEFDRPWVVSIAEVLPLERAWELAPGAPVLPVGVEGRYIAFAAPIDNLNGGALFLSSTNSYQFWYDERRRCDPWDPTL